MTYEGDINYFFGELNDEFYYRITYSIFELLYDEAIKYDKDNNFYDETINKLSLLENENTPTVEFYKFIIK